MTALGPIPATAASVNGMTGTSRSHPFLGALSKAEPSGCGRGRAALQVLSIHYLPFLNAPRQLGALTFIDQMCYLHACMHAFLHACTHSFMHAMHAPWKFTMKFARGWEGSARESTSGLQRGLGHCGEVAITPNTVSRAGCCGKFPRGHRAHAVGAGQAGGLWE